MNPQAVPSGLTTTLRDRNWSKDENDCNVIFFFFSRLRPGTTLFERLPPRTASVSRRVKPSCACVKKGNRRFNTCDVKPLPDPDKGGKPVKPIKVRPHPKKPGKTDNRDYDPNAVNYVFKPPKVKYRVPTWPTRTGITRKKAIRQCKKEMRRIIRVCKKVVNAKKLKCMTECVTDIKVSCKYVTDVKIVFAWQTTRLVVNAWEMCVNVR